MATLQQKIMRRVWAIFFVRKATSASALRLYSLVFLAYESSVLFNVRDIMTNMPSVFEASRLVSFYSTAFIQTGLTAQIVLAAIIAIGGFSAWRAARYVLRSVRPATIGQYA